jgi:hypothetical protein
MKSAAAIARIATWRRSSPTRRSAPAQALRLNPETAKALWAKSEEMVGERF